MEQLLLFLKDSRSLFPEPIQVLKRTIYFLRGLIELPPVIKLLKAEGNPLLAAELQSRPRLREFIYRPWLNSYWGLKDRLEAIANHYKLVNDHVPLFNLAHDECRELTQFDFGNEKLRVILDRPSWMRREGEFGLSFFLGIDRIYTIMFTLAGSSGDLKLLVGNVQGDGRDRSDIYRELTKAMHGMRPRDFLIHTLKILGAELGCKEIHGISDDAHRSSVWYSRAKKLSTYDEMWLEHGGIKQNTGFFVMPCKFEKRSEAEIPSKKRALYRKRYQFMDDLQVTLRNKIMSPPKKRHIHSMHDHYKGG